MVGLILKRIWALLLIQVFVLKHPLRTIKVRDHNVGAYRYKKGRRLVTLLFSAVI